MADIDNYRSGPELRRKRRKQFYYRASILTPGTQAPRSCTIADISETGAKVTLDTADELPEQFLLMLTSNGSARRLCHAVWRDGLTVGVKFIRGAD